MLMFKFNCRCYPCGTSVSPLNSSFSNKSLSESSRVIRKQKQLISPVTVRAYPITFEVPSSPRPRDSIEYELMTAIKSRNSTRIIQLITSASTRAVKVDGNVTCDTQGNTLLMLLIDAKHIEALEMILVTNRPFRCNLSKQSLLHIAARCGDEDILTSVISAFHNDLSEWINATDETGKTPLMFAASNMPCLQSLLDAGADVNIQDHYGNFALLLFTCTGDLQGIKLLVEKHLADITLVTNTGKTCLFEAIRFGFLEIFQYFLSLPSIDLNHRLVDGSTLLIYAARYGRIQIVKLLIARGIDVHLSDCNGMNALMESASNGYLQISKLLVGQGIDINAIDNICGYSALFFACLNSCIEVCSFLIENGANINVCLRDSGVTLLMMMIEENNELIIDLLLRQQQIQLYHIDIDHWTEMHYALYVSNPHIVKALVVAGAVITSDLQQIVSKILNKLKYGEYRISKCESLRRITYRHNPQYSRRKEFLCLHYSICRQIDNFSETNSRQIVKLLNDVKLTQQLCSFI